MSVVWLVLITVGVALVVPVGACYASTAVAALLWRREFGEPLGRERHRRLRAAFWDGFTFRDRWGR